MADEKSLTGLEDTLKGLASVWGGKPAAAPPAADPQPAADPVKARGIGLRLSEWADLDKIAAELGIKPHALAAHALRDWLKRYAAGEIPTETGRRLK